MVHSIPKWIQLSPNLNYVGLNTGLRHPQNIRKVRTNANDNPDAPPTSMTQEEAREILGVSAITRFDEILAAKNKLKRKTTDEKTAKQIENAYDLLFMSSMRDRITGDRQVPDRVKFADVEKPRPKQLPGGVLVEAPPQNVLSANSVAFGAIGCWALLQGIAAPDLPNGFDFVPSFPLALGVGWCIYSFVQYKKFGLGKAMGYTAGGLVAGSIIGGLIQAGIRIDEHPIGAFSSPATFVSEFAFLSLWGASTYLK